jgi:hypothetical protein
VDLAAIVVMIGEPASSSHAAPVKQSDDPSTICGESTDATNEGYYEFKWDRDGVTRLSKNPNGTSGWATVTHCTNPAVLLAGNHRIHLCKFKPCRAIYHSSKYGMVAPPIHLQEVHLKCESSAVAELSGSHLPLPADVQTAVAGTSTETPPLATELVPKEPALVLEQVPVEQQPVNIEGPVEEAVVYTDMLDAPDCPNEASLQNMKPPAPTSPIHSMHMDSQGVANDAAAVKSAVAAKHTIKAALLTLARGIRRPRSYVGYSAFILMGLLKKCQPCVWEGASFINLIEVFAPWATEACSSPVTVVAVAVAVIAQPEGSVEMVAISKEHPLSTTCHFVAGIKVPECKALESALSIETLYASLGVAIIASVMDGDCALDVMTMMLGIPPSEAARKELRIDISDYLIARIGEPWLHDIMVACQELCAEDLHLYKSLAVGVIAAPTAPAPAVADLAGATAEHKDAVPPDDETIAAMRWSSKLDDDFCVLSLIRKLPTAIVEEQVSLYRRRTETAVAVGAQKQGPMAKIPVGPQARLQTRMLVAQRFHRYCHANAITANTRMPYGAMKTFIKDNIVWTAKQRVVSARSIRDWHATWSSSASNVLVAAVADKDAPVKAPSQASFLRSRAPVALHQRRRDYGGGRPHKAYIVRAALYEWFTSIRYAIDWKQYIAENRSRGRKHLARFPRSVLRIKAQQLIQDYAYSCLLNGVPGASINLDSWWFKRWEEEYGLSMRAANRKYAVPRPVVKERMEIFWVVLFRVRLLIVLSFGYEALIQNFDQSPFHHNETGSQNKATLAVRGSIVPVVEGNSDVKSRWTANLTTQSLYTGSSDDPMPSCECMFKAEKDGSIDRRLQAFLRSRGFPHWFTVTVGPKGSYREHDIIEWLQKHLEPWREGRDWRIYLCDDYAAHKSKNVWNLCWSRGYVRHVHGGGTTPVAQTPDTDLNQHVRCRYGYLESRLLLEKMRSGQVVPKLTHEECMDLMLEVLNDVALHKRASEGYKKVGQSIDLYGTEDLLVCREAGAYWNEETTDKFPNMRPKIDAELAAVADEFRSGGITWCERDVLRLITPYPRRGMVDRVLKNLGEDFYHDDVHCFTNGDDDAAVAEGDQKAAESSSDGDDGDGESAEHDLAAVADEGGEGVEILEIAGSRTESAPLSSGEADAVHTVKATMAALEATLEGLRAIGSVRGVQCIELELSKEKRKARQLITESPAVADAFLNLRRAEDRERLMQKRMVDQHNDRKRDAAKALADRNTAVAEFRETRRKIQEMESIGACRHAIKTFTLDALGEGNDSAGGVKARKNRFEVLDRMGRIAAGLSAGQKNDWPWFKDAWDKEMVTHHGVNWASVFAKWMQNVLEDECSNAFSTFVYNETCRVFHGIAALHVPGG